MMMNKPESVYLGTSGLVLPYKNSLEYPPEFEGQSRMFVYANILNSIEINSIFYKLPRQATIGNWVEATGEEFRFTFKLSKQVTHSPALDFQEDDVRNFLNVIHPAKDRKGCILVQFPPSIKRTSMEKVSHLLDTLKKLNTDNWPVAVEFRHASWYAESTYDFLNEHSMVMVYHDKRGSASPIPAFEADFVYLRFHGPDGDYKGSYDRGILSEFAGYIAGWTANGKTVYVYFNNTMGAALDNLKTLEQFLLTDFSIT